MRSFALAAALVLSASFGVARDVQLLDPAVFGEPTSRPVAPLFEKKGNEVAPWYFQLDVGCDRYTAATVTYSGTTIGLEEVRASLNARYAQYQVRTPSGRLQESLWRIEREGSDDALVIQLSGEDGDCENDVRVIYVLSAKWAMQCRRGILLAGGADARRAPKGAPADGSVPSADESCGH